jgi:MFS family permease
MRWRSQHERFDNWSRHRRYWGLWHVYWVRLMWGNSAEGCSQFDTYGLFSVLSYISTFTTLRRQPVYISAIGFVWGVGTILGPAIGGAFANSSATWRWVRNLVRLT